MGLLFGFCCDVISEKSGDGCDEADDEDGEQAVECAACGGCGLYGARDGVGADDGVGACDGGCGVGSVSAVVVAQAQVLCAGEVDVAVYGVGVVDGVACCPCGGV